MATRNFLRNPLVCWLKLCLDDPVELASYENLSDGFLIHKVFLKIDPLPEFSISPAGGNKSSKLKNLKKITKNMSIFYEKQAQTILLLEPDCEELVYGSAEAQIKEMELMLSLLLGCALVCSNKEYFEEIFSKLSADLPEEKHCELIEYYQSLEDKYAVVSKETHPDLFYNLKKIVGDKKCNGAESTDGNWDSKEAILTTELVSCKSQSRAQVEEIIRLQETLQTSETKLNQSEAMCKDLQHQIKRCKSANEILSGEKRDLIEALETFKTEEETLILNKIERTNEELEKAKISIQFYRDKFDEVIEQCEDLRSETEKLETGNKRYKTRIQELELVNNQLKVKIKSLQDQEPKIGQVTFQTVDKNQLKELKSENAKLKQTVESLKQSLNSNVAKNKPYDSGIKLSKDLPLVKQYENALLFHKSHYIKGHTSVVDRSNILYLIDLHERLLHEEKLKMKLLKSTKEELEEREKNFAEVNKTLGKKVNSSTTGCSCCQIKGCHHQQLRKFTLETIKIVIEVDEMPGFGFEVAQKYRLKLLKHLYNIFLFLQKLEL